jgi:hypothetical protein
MAIELPRELNPFLLLLYSVLEKLLLPAVKHRRLQAQFFTQIRNRHFVQKMPPQNGNLFFSSVVLTLFPDTFAPLS